MERMERSDFVPGGIKISAQLAPAASDEEFCLLEQLGVQYCYTWLEPEQMNEAFLRGFQDKCRQHGLTLYNVGVAAYGKSAAIQLGLPECGEHTEKFKELLRLLGKLKIGVTTITWEPNCAWCTTPEGKCGRELYLPVGRGGAWTRECDAELLKKVPLSHGREYTRDEIWKNFRLFLESVLPTAQKAGVCIALHPNDPPVSASAGIETFLTSSQDYRKVFEMASARQLGMELCMGCWLEGGAAFGDLKKDIRTFVRQGRVAVVHFRNVIGTLPRFRESFLDDGDANMYELMKILVEEGYHGTLTFDHVPAIPDFPKASESYAIGYMKALLCAAQEECRREGH